MGSRGRRKLTRFLDEGIAVTEVYPAAELYCVACALQSICRAIRAILLGGVISLSLCTETPLPVENVEKKSFRDHASKDHVLEELQHQINTKNKEEMTDRELQFHYFKLHDFDNNNHLDGLEIVKALRHQHDEHEKEQNGNHTDPFMAESEVMDIVNNVLKQDDHNFDGLISFWEFMSSNE